MITITIKEGYSEPGTHCSLFIDITDNGKGMDAVTVKQVTDPFYTTRTSRRVGLGIPMFKASAESGGGYVNITSELDKGTVIQAAFDSDNVDCLPIGHMEDTMAVLVLCNPDVDFIYTHEYKTNILVVDTMKIKEQLEDLSIGHPEVVCWLKDYIKSGLNEIYGGA